MTLNTWIVLTPVALLLAGCTGEGPTATERYAMDPHSHARPEEAVITHLDLDISVDFESRTVSGVATYDIKAEGADSIVFDTDGLTIEGVTIGDGAAAEFALGDSSFLGRALAVKILPGTQRVSITYHTSDRSSALQWLSPQQTADRAQPFLFTQGEAILARTWIPVQDSPGIRFTYTATVHVPNNLMAVMSAANPQIKSADGVYYFNMVQPIPAYLVALAVGDLAFEATGPRTGVYAEQSVVHKAAWEFADMGRMLDIAEGLYGPYRWERYDVIVLPPSFPFGGMENPRLTFATPTIIAGDRSLAALIAHEMAHSWSGNLVTNATWNDFWLNEGFTVYFENRICEAIYGKDYAEMLQLLGRQDLVKTIADIAKGDHPEDSHLLLELKGREPDDGMTDVAYEKGFAFLRLIEDKVGRPKFDAFLRAYFDRFAFQSMTTDRFVTYLQEELLGPNNVKLDVAPWVNGAGLPPNAPEPLSDRFVMVDVESQRWTDGTPARELNVGRWSTFEWMHFLRQLPRALPEARMDELDSTFHFTASGNSEILAAWLEQCVHNDYDPAFPRLDEFLTNVGRRKFLVPLYTALIDTEKGRIMAQNIYAHARPNYHAVSVRTLDDLLNWKDNHPSVAF
ncbi:MAG: M1 family metallopeptidase [Flavobacteriales bacterium]